MDGDENLIITLINNAPEKDNSIEMTVNDAIQRVETSTLDTPLKTKTAEDLLPQVRAFDQVDRLQFEDQCFLEYESNLRVLKNQIDSLKSIVTAFEKKNKQCQCQQRNLRPD